MAKKTAGAARRAPRARRSRRVAEEPAHVASPTAVSGEALRTGVEPRRTARPEIEVPHEGELQAGERDASVLANTYVGDEAPGGSMSTPDQNRVDDIGRALGVEEADSGALRSSSEILDERDRKRPDLEGPERSEE